MKCTLPPPTPPPPCTGSRQREWMRPINYTLVRFHLLPSFTGNSTSEMSCFSFLKGLRCRKTNLESGSSTLWCRMEVPLIPRLAVFYIFCSPVPPPHLILWPLWPWLDITPKFSCPGLTDSQTWFSLRRRTWKSSQVSKASSVIPMQRILESGEASLHGEWHRMVTGTKENIFFLGFSNNI